MYLPRLAPPPRLWYLLCIMKHSAALLASLVALSSTTFAGDGLPEPDDTGWIQLFNGKDLEGWTPKIRFEKLGEDKRNTFRVEDGMISLQSEGHPCEFRKVAIQRLK